MMSASAFPTQAAGRMNRRAFLQALGAGAALWVGRDVLGAGAAQNDPLNVVLILVDDLGWADLACYGSRYYDTPNLDRLARQGMRFTDAYAACAVCSPTRAAIMTGRYPARLGITDWIRSLFQKGITPDQKQPEYEDVGRALLCPTNAAGLPREELTIAETLKSAGYATCHIGKWHLGTDGWYPDDQGFDQNIGGCDYGQPPSYYDPYSNKGQGSIPTLKPRRVGEYLTDREADEAVNFIRQHRDQPFFLHMAHYAVHTPIQAKKQLLAKYQQREKTAQKNPAYATMVESVDQAVGRIMATLEALNLAERTLVIFTSDNGGLLGPTNNSPLRAGKGYPYEGGIRVPLIVRWPGTVKPGSTCDVPVTSVDYFPTICQAVGGKLPTDRTIDGESLLPVLRGSGGLKRDAIFWHFPHYRGNDVPPYSIIRAGDWKLIKRYEGRTYELFNLREDLREKEDLADRMPQKVKELDAKLVAWLKQTGAKMPKPKESA